MKKICNKERVLERFPRAQLRSGTLSDDVTMAYGVFETPATLARMLSFGWWYSEEEAWQSAARESLL